MNYDTNDIWTRTLHDGGLSESRLSTSSQNQSKQRHGAKRPLMAFPDSKATLNTTQRYPPSTTHYGYYARRTITQWTQWHESRKTFQYEHSTTSFWLTDECFSMLMCSWSTRVCTCADNHLHVSYQSTSLTYSLHRPSITKPNRHNISRTITAGLKSLESCYMYEQLYDRGDRSRKTHALAELIAENA